MKKNLQELMMTFGITIGKRYSLKQKNDFYGAVETYFSNLGYSVNRQTQSSRTQVNNIIVGDISNADVIYAAAYDTPLRAIWPAFKYFPLHMDRNLKEERKNIFLSIIICIILCAAVYVAAYIFLAVSGVHRVMAGLIIAILLVLTFMLFKKRANTFNFTRNSASIALMCNIAYESKKRRKTAFVFLDKNSSSNEGWKQLGDMLKSCRGVIITLDCIAYGDNIVAAYREDGSAKVCSCVQKLRASGIGDKIITKSYDDSKISQNALAYYKDMIILSAGSVYKKDFAVYNTCSKKDILWDVDMLLSLTDELVSL